MINIADGLSCREGYYWWEIQLTYILEWFPNVDCVKVISTTYSLDIQNGDNGPQYLILKMIFYDILLL